MVYSVKTFGSILAIATSLFATSTLHAAEPANNSLNTSVDHTAFSAATKQSALLSFSDIKTINNTNPNAHSLAGLEFKMLDVKSPTTDLFTAEDSKQFSSNQTYVRVNNHNLTPNIDNELTYFNLASFSIKNNKLVKKEKSQLFGEKILKSLTGVELVK